MSRQIEERQRVVEKLLERVMGPEAPETSGDDLGEPTGVRDPLGTRLSFRNGDKYRRLRDGDTTDYDSNSEADMAYASGLSWVVGNDPDVVATNSEQRIGELERLQAGTLTGWLAIQEAKGEEILRDFYRDTQLKVVTDGQDVEITWVGGRVDSQSVASVLTLATRR